MPFLRLASAFLAPLALLAALRRRLDRGGSPQLPLPLRRPGTLLLLSCALLRFLLLADALLGGLLLPQ